MRGEFSWYDQNRQTMNFVVVVDSLGCMNEWKVCEKEFIGEIITFDPYVAMRSTISTQKKMRDEIYLQITTKHIISLYRTFKIITILSARAH